MQGDVFLLGLQGTHCGVPVAIQLEYLQIQPDIPGENPGKSLVDGWFVDAGAPWLIIRTLLSSELVWQCATYSSPTSKGAVFLTGAGGLAAGLPLPSTAAIMFIIRARGPHPGPNPSRPRYFAGRFFLPGGLVAQTNTYQWIATSIPTYQTFADATVNIAPAGQTGTMFRLMPFANMIENPIGGPGAEKTAIHVYADPLIRRVKTRRPTQCQIFGQQGLGEGQEGVVVPGEG